MSNQLWADAQANPHAFSWEGPLDRDTIRKWLRKYGLAVPEELIELWTVTGGGEMFETETLLKPVAGEEDSDSIVAVNSALTEQGLPRDYLVFHTGSTVSAIRVQDGKIVELSQPGFFEIRRFPSLEDWYTSIIRDEYAGRYGLEPHP